jgi:hypothetical protein
MLRLNLEALKLFIVITTSGLCCSKLQENLINLTPTYSPSHWIQINFYPNPDGPPLYYQFFQKASTEILHRETCF